MTMLVLGLILFLGIHLLPIVPVARQALLAHWGERRYKGLFSIVSLAGFALIIAGYVYAGRGPQLFAPSTAAIHIAPFAVTLAFILFAAANMRGRIRAALRHPMLIGLIIWATVHLLANGDQRGTVLFGAFLAYAIVDLVSAIARNAVKTFEVTPRHDVMAVVGGVVVALLVMTFHRLLFGPRVVPFGI